VVLETGQVAYFSLENGVVLVWVVGFLELEVVVTDLVRFRVAGKHCYGYVLALFEVLGAVVCC
jgi:hypothetical protein